MNRAPLGNVDHMKWLFEHLADQQFVVCMFLTLCVVNAFAMANGWY